MREKILELFQKVNRVGFKALLDSMTKKGYFDCPASTRYHGNYRGGLVEHCYNVYVLFKDNISRFDLRLSEESMIICAFLHDLCKVDGYVFTKKGIVHFKKHPKGHAIRSIEIITEHMKLTEKEEMIIRYHMGYYGSYSFSVKNGEYTIRELTDAFNKERLTKLFYFCDDTSSQFLEKTR